MAESDEVEELAAVIWKATRSDLASWEARLSWLSVSPEERMRLIAKGVDPDNFDWNGDIEDARTIARAVLAHQRAAYERDMKELKAAGRTQTDGAADPKVFT